MTSKDKLPALVKSFIELFLIGFILFTGKVLAAGVGEELMVTLVSGATGNPIPQHRVAAYEKLPDGTEKWMRQAYTDANGKALIQLPGISEGRLYILKAKNPFDGRTKKSDVISRPGSQKFVVGNKIINISVTNGITNTPMENRPVVVYRRLADGKLKGVRTENTDGRGRLALDLPGLGAGTIYVLRTQQQHGSGRAFSGDIKATGTYTFKVGNIRLKVINGQTDTVLSDFKVAAYKRSEAGKFSWFSAAKTNAKGLVAFDLPGLGAGQQYVFKGVNPFDAQYWTSRVFTKTGTGSFILGNKLLNFSLLNALNGEGIANVEVTAYERLADQSLKWIQEKTTDAAGQLDFALPGLGNDSQYVLRAAPYRMRLTTKDISETGKFEMLAGAVPVVLRKEKDGTLMPGHKLTLFEKTAAGKLQWRVSAVTDAKGMVRFDSEGLGTGRVFVVRAYNLFGNNKPYYSRWILQKGVVEFSVDPDDSHKLDEESPQFVSFYPAANATLADKGFQLRTQVLDNQRVHEVNIRVIDPKKGVTSGHATLVNNEWVFSVTKAMISTDQYITVEAEAVDKVGNKTRVSYRYRVINDTTKPEIIISSYGNGAQVDEHGFLITGLTTDNTGFVKLQATVTDPVLGVVIDHRELEIGRNNHWALVAGKLTRGKVVRVDLLATDSAGNIANTPLLLNVMTESVGAAQLINRITFGATPELLTELRALGSEAFIQQQLHPERIDDSNFEHRLTEMLNSETSMLKKLQFAQLARAAYSKRQLLEVMTQFWENHFNTDLSKVGNVGYEVSENDAFRQHALGNFRNLLEASATSPAMLIYLDNKNSHKNEPNENYARELLELHTLGIDNGYNAQDIVNVARVFTGWRIRDGAFYFEKRRHDDSEKIVLNTVIPAGSGVSGGYQVLDLLAHHQGTAQFICTKLLKVLVSDTPSSAMINQCADDFIFFADEIDQIAQVLEGIIKSTAFSESLNFHNKVKTPLEYVVGLARQLPVNVSFSRTRTQLRAMGMHLFHNPVPTGWPEEGKRWVDSNQLTQRWQISGEILYSKPSIWRSHLSEPSQFFLNHGIETSEGILGYLFELTMTHDYTKLEWEEALAVLTNKKTEIFNIYAADADDKLRRLMAIVFNYPAYQLQ